MDNQTLQAIVDEIAPILQGKTIGKIFQLGKYQLVIDFRADGRYLLLNFEPAKTPQIYLVRRRVRDLEKQSEINGNFVLFTRKRLSNARLTKIAKDENDRIVRFQFLAENERGDVEKFTLAAQFTGRAANLYLLDAENGILESLREGLDAGEIYAPPVFEAKDGEREIENLLDKVAAIEVRQSDYEFSIAAPLSEKLDVYFSSLESEREFESNAVRARKFLRQQIERKENLLTKLNNDLNRHGNAEESKKRGDLLLANVSTARRVGNQIFVVDYFDANAPEVAIKADENLSLPEAAKKFFTKYAKARNAANQLTGRIADLRTDAADLKAKQSALEAIIAERDNLKLSEFVEKENLSGAKPKFEDKPRSKKEPEITSGVRRYRSSDGLEILVGRNSRDNDYLTVRVAKSLDWWLHAADYSGSHVVVRNPSKGELPSKTLLEAAQLAAKFSQAGKDAKVAVNYTQRKFVNKPKNAAPGLVRLASFRTILVEPKESGERIL